MDSKAKEHLLPRARIEELESMRGLAALLVVLFHAPGWNSGKEFIPFIANGYLMVDVFFVLSGFVIFKAYANTIRCAHDLWRFQFLRLGRLYPVHFFFLLFFLVTTATPFWQTHWDALFEQLFLVQAIGPTGNAITFNYPAWSISVEFYTYLLFGVVVLLAPMRQIWIFSGLVLLALLALLTQHTFGFIDLLRCWCGFFMGCLAAFLVAKVNWRWSSKIAGIAAIVLLAFLQFKPNANWDPAIYFLTALLIIALVLSPLGMVKRILQLPPLIWLGEISYSLYMAQLAVIYLNYEILARLYHKWPFLNQLEASLGLHFLNPISMQDSLIRYAFFLLSLLCLSWLTYVVIEKPFRILSRRLALAPKLPS